MKGALAISKDPKRGAIAAGMGFTNPNSMSMHIAFDFDCPNYAYFAKWKPSLPLFAKFQICAIVREVATFDSEEEYYANRPYKLIEKGEALVNSGISSQFFGTQEFMKPKDEETKTEAIFVGHVIKTEKKINELTGQSFYWALIETAGGMELDVVIHTKFIEEGGIKPPKVGGILRGYGWLSGKLLSVL
ncbi:MAG: hypothetical protein SGARI_005095 [Bacillariaceae sp.]